MKASLSRGLRFLSLPLISAPQEFEPEQYESRETSCVFPRVDGVEYFMGVKVSPSSRVFEMTSQCQLSC